MDLLSELEKRCGEMSSLWLYSWGLLLVAGVGVVDFFSGPEISLSVLYLIPVALGAWCAGKPAGHVLSVAAAVVWLSIDYASNHAYTQEWIVFWNALVRLAFFLITAHLLSTLRSYLDREYALLRIDKLTGAKNAQAFKEEIRFLLKLAARHGHTTALAYLDLDHFKEVNDAMGDKEGDRILQTIVMALSLSGRSTDVVGRLGGDEFAILLPETDMAGARHALDKLHGRVNQIIQDQGWPISLSMAVVAFPDKQPNVTEALKSAESLLRRVKHEQAGGVIYEMYAGNNLATREFAGT